MDRLDSAEQAQLADQLIAVMDTHRSHPQAEEKCRILQMALARIASAQPSGGHLFIDATGPRPVVTGNLSIDANRAQR